MGRDVSALKCDIAVRFHAPPPDLARFFTTFYRVEISVPEGERVADALQPGWGVAYHAAQTP